MGDKIHEGTLSAKDKRFAVVVSRFNDLITTRLRDGALDCLQRHGSDQDAIEIAWVPGAFELPIVAQSLASSGSYQVIVTLGAVIRGDTPHFDVVVAEASKGIASVSREIGLPIIFGVLTTDTMQQALERAGIKNNLGWSYALQALEMGSLMKAIA